MSDLKATDYDLINAYKAKGVPLEFMVYTPIFDELVDAYNETLGPDTEKFTAVQVYRKLVEINGKGYLPRVMQ